MKAPLSLQRRVGDSFAVPSQVSDVWQVKAMKPAFAAILRDGPGVTWGNVDRGGTGCAI